MIRGVPDVLDALACAGYEVAAHRGGDAHAAGAPSAAPLGLSRRHEAALQRAALPDDLRSLLGAIGDGWDTAAAIARSGVSPERGLAALASLELGGYVRRVHGGRYELIL